MQPRAIRSGTSCARGGRSGVPRRLVASTAGDSSTMNLAGCKPAKVGSQRRTNWLKRSRCSITSSASMSHRRPSRSEVKMSICHCAEGWICEAHPDLPARHDGGTWSSTQCRNPDCLCWKGPIASGARHVGLDDHREQESETANAHASLTRPTFAPASSGKRRYQTYPSHQDEVACRAALPVTSHLRPPEHRRVAAAAP